MWYPAGVVGTGSWDRSARAAARAGSEKVWSLVEGLWKGSPQRVRAPYTKTQGLPDRIPSSTEPVKFGVNPAGPPAKPEYSLVTDSGLVPRGKGEKYPGRGGK